MKRRWLLALLALLPVSGTAGTDEVLDQGYNDMYNLAFNDAHRSFEGWERSHGNDPMGPVSDAAAYLFSEFHRLHILESEFFVRDSALFHRRTEVPDGAVKLEFDNALQRTQQLADSILQHSADDERALFATVLRLGLEADYMALIEKRYLASLDDVKQGRSKAEQLLAKHPDCYDAYLAIGVENYLLSLKPAPVRWILRMNGARTDRETGLAKLRLTAEKGHYLKPYAELLLAVAALRDGNQLEARRLLSGLSARFPQNELYRQELEKVGRG